MNSLKLDSKSKSIFWYVILLCILFPLVYFKLFSAGFVSWDDGEVLLNNKAVHDFNIKAFFTSYYVGNYAPVTMISFAMDWAIWHGNSFGHHFMNICIHFVNGLLVFYVTQQLFKNQLVAFVCALVFCFHPLQIETVAWVSAKNNLLYTAFFLSGLLFYIKYNLYKLKKHLFISFLFFLISCLSKPSAICFPICIIAFDLVFNRDLRLKSYLNKLPFLLLAIGTGIITLYTRTEDKFINEDHAFALHERIGYAGYAILQYIYKFFIPINLSVIYPYPQHKWLSIITGYLIILLLIFSCYKLYKAKKNRTLFGLLFFVSNLLLVLQFIPFGEVLTADRYMYLPMLGLCWTLFSFISLKENQLKIVGGLLVVSLGILSFMRADVWKNSISLYGDIIKKYPQSVLALNSIGAEYLLQKNYDVSLRYLNQAVHENTSYYKGYYNRGLLYAQTNRMKNALQDFTKAIELYPYLKAYTARANVYYTMKDFPKAIADAETVLKTESENVKATYVLANCYDDLNQLDKALMYYNKAIVLDTEEPLFYLRRAILFGKKQNLNASLKDLDVCTHINPNFAEAYFWKGVVKVNLNQNPCKDLKKAVNLGFTAAEQALIKYCR